MPLFEHYHPAAVELSMQPTARTLRELSRDPFDWIESDEDRAANESQLVEPERPPIDAKVLRLAVAIALVTAALIALAFLVMRTG
jgi:hypothetical protein